MREFQAPVKFLVWVVGIVMTLGLLGQLPKLTYKAAEMAIDAHQNHQMSYGKFSRKLWSKKPIQKKWRIRKTIGIFDPNLKYQPDSFSVLNWSIFKFSSLSWCSGKGF